MSQVYPTALKKAMGPGFTLEGIVLKTTYLSAKGVSYEDPSFTRKILSCRRNTDLSFPSLSFEKIFNHKRLTVSGLPSFSIDREKGAWSAMGDAERGGWGERDF